MKSKTLYSTHLDIDSNRAEIIDCIFSNCYHSSHGGAIFINSISTLFICLSSTFNQCRSEQYGGAICAYTSNHSVYKTTCYHKCSGILASVLVWGHLQKNFYLEFNLSTEYYETDCFCSGLLGTTSSIVTNNNFSKSYSYLVAGVQIGTGTQSTLMSYCQVSKAVGGFIISVQNSKNGINPIVSHVNFIEVQASRAFLHLAHFSSNPHFDSCAFITNTKSKLVEENPYYGSPSFNGCSFSFSYDSALYSSIQTNSNSFNHNTQNMFPAVDSYLCWNVLAVTKGSNFMGSNRFAELLVLTLSAILV